MVWADSDREVRLARIREEFEPAERWQAAADDIHAEIYAHGIAER